jgi:hypothetical protein
VARPQISMFVSLRQIQSYCTSSWSRAREGISRPSSAAAGGPTNSWPEIS